MIDLVIGSDHRGYNLKESISKHLIPIDKDIEKDITTFLDCGCYDPNKSVDYPNVVKSLATELNSTFNMGILICGSGLGVCIAANRYKNIREVYCKSEKSSSLFSNIELLHKSKRDLSGKQNAIITFG